MIKIDNRVKKEKQIVTSIERSPVALLGINYKVKIVYKNINITELDVKNKIIQISLPIKYKKVANPNILDLAIKKMYEQVAKVEIERAMEKYRIMLGFAPDEYEIKNIKKLGKTNEQKIIINPDIITFSRDVIDYVVLYQYCSMKYKKNTEQFLEMVKKYKPNYLKCQEILMKI